MDIPLAYQRAMRSFYHVANTYPHHSSCLVPREHVAASGQFVICQLLNIYIHTHTLLYWLFLYNYSSIKPLFEPLLKASPTHRVSPLNPFLSSDVLQWEGAVGEGHGGAVGWPPRSDGGPEWRSRRGGNRDVLRHIELHSPRPTDTTPRPGAVLHTCRYYSTPLICYNPVGQWISSGCAYWMVNSWICHCTESHTFSYLSGSLSENARLLLAVPVTSICRSTL